MKIVIFGHPNFLYSQSMPRFLRMLAEGMRSRGHNVEVWQPKPKFFNYNVPVGLKKWMGYIDQFIIFPREVKKRIKKQSSDTLYVFADQALGPWVKLVSDKKHVIHCHDFLALRSALGEIPQNPTKWTGKLYQYYIRKGFQNGNNFIPISKRTCDDLHRFLNKAPEISTVIYNGLNGEFVPQDIDYCRESVSNEFGLNLREGYWLHVGGNQWYKNRPMVIELYSAWRASSSNNLPLVMIGAKPDEKLKKAYELSSYKDNIYLLHGVEDDSVKKAYSGASLFVFPSIAEGFGWPIAEAMACGCIVMTTGEAPMTEVGGKAAFYLPVLNVGDNIPSTLLRKIDELVNLSDHKREELRRSAFKQVEKFNKDKALDYIESVYFQVLSA